MVNLSLFYNYVQIICLLYVFMLLYCYLPIGCWTFHWFGRREVCLWVNLVSQCHFLQTIWVFSQIFILIMTPFKDSWQCFGIIPHTAIGFNFFEKRKKNFYFHKLLFFFFKTSLFSEVQKCVIQALLVCNIAWSFALLPSIFVTSLLFNKFICSSYWLA